MRAFSALAMVALVVACAACSDPTSDESPPIIQPIGKGPAVLQATVGAQSDTIDALSTFGVQVLDSAGFAAKNTTVVFSVLPDSTRAGIPVRISAQNEFVFGSVVSAVTDANGKATVRVLYGSRTGTSRLRAVAVESQTSLIVTYTTLIGQPARIATTPDAAIVPGEVVKFTGMTFDRDGNLRTELPIFTAASGFADVAVDGTITGVRPGLQPVEAHLTANGKLLSATSTVWVLPLDTITSVGARQSGSNIYLNILLRDLSGRPGTAVSPQPSTQMASSWQPGRNRVAFEQFPSVIIRSPTGGEINTGQGEWPEFSPDGQWIYLDSFVPNGFHIYRMRPDGTGREVVTPNDAGTAPTVSPDGNSVAFASGNLLRVIDLRTSQVRTIAQAQPNGQILAPRWSPDGRYIAYGGSGLTLVNPDIGASSVTQVPGNLNAGEGIAWSPDSQWIVVPGFIVYVPTLQSRAVTTIGRFPSWKR